MIRGGQSRPAEVLPPIQGGSRQLLAVGQNSSFQAVVAPQRDGLNDGQVQSKTGTVAGANGTTSNRQTNQMNSSSVRPRKKPLFSDSSANTSKDKEIIEGIRADLRAKFAGSFGQLRPDTGGQSTAASTMQVQEVNIELADRFEDVLLMNSGGEFPGGTIYPSSSAPDVGQLKQLDIKNNSILGPSDGRTRDGADTSSTRLAGDEGSDIVIAAHVSAVGRYAEQLRASSRLSSHSRSKRYNNSHAGNSRSPNKFLSSPPPSSSTFFRGPADYSLPPVNQGLTTIPSRHIARHSIASSHRPRLKPASPQTTVHLRQPHQQAKVEEARSVQQEYVSIVGKVSLTKKIYTTEQRDGLLWIPCPRCQHKGNRCSTCTVIRVGGGYIILEGDEDLSKYQKAYLRKHHSAYTDDDGELKVQSRPGTGYKAGWKRAGDSDQEEHDINGRASSMRGAGDTIPEGDGDEEGNEGEGDDDNNGDDAEYSGWARKQSARVSSGAGDGRDTGDGRNSTRSNFQGRPASARKGLDSRGGRVPSAKGNRSGSRLSSHKDEGDQGDGNSVKVTVEITDNADGQGDNDGTWTGDGGSGRPPSAKQGGQKNRSLRHRLKENDNGSSGFHSARGGRQAKSPLGGEGGFLGEPTSRSNSQMQHRLKSAPPTPRADDTVRRRKKGRAGDVLDESDEELDEDGDFDPATRHKLRKFKYKREQKDSMGVKECDWQDLKGIDPLDYLAKYCIVDQDRIPTYERIYHNVDLDEDDEITLDQLDFALKAVNNNLISDPEMDFVFHVLELAHRPKLNFKLFCLVAALSERVVMLEDMVKKLVHKMDFEALEVKMKKVKELFYLLADMEHKGGVVTTGNLAIELTAGGLTPEHVKLVVNHLNRDKKGLVQFLDYLTYVPLFLEIHGSIVSNPLDQKRDK